MSCTHILSNQQADWVDRSDFLREVILPFHSSPVLCVCYLREALLAGGSDFGDGGEDFTRTSWCHHLGGQDCDWTVSTCKGEELHQSPT